MNADGEAIALNPDASDEPVARAQTAQFAGRVDSAAAGGVRLWRVIVAWLCALGVAGVFLFAGIEKIIEPRQFVIAIKNYRILPEPYLNAMALILPWLECVAAVALIVPRTRRAGAFLITGMLIMFITAVSYSALYKGLNIDCGCFGKANPSAAGIRTILLDSGLLVATALAVLLPRRRCPARSSQA